MKSWVFKGHINIPASVVVTANTMDEAIEKIGDPGLPTNQYAFIRSEKRPVKPDFVWNDETPIEKQIPISP